MVYLTDKKTNDALVEENKKMNNEEICYLDHFNEICLSEKENVTINCGGHKIKINKLFGPTDIKPITICFEGNDWNVRNIINRLRAENRELKKKLNLTEKELKNE